MFDFIETINKTSFAIGGLSIAVLIWARKIINDRMDLFKQETRDETHLILYRKIENDYWYSKYSYGTEDLMVKLRQKIDNGFLEFRITTLNKKQK